jgi:hypothetical protein
MQKVGESEYGQVDSQCGILNMLGGFHGEAAQFYAINVLLRYINQIQDEEWFLHRSYHCGFP